MILGHPKVLVIDDDAAVSALFEALLTRAGCYVEHARDGLSGRDKLDGNGDYSAIILDLMMPNLGGLELLDQLTVTTGPVAPISTRSTPEESTL